MKKKDLPIYDITIDDIDEAGVKFISLVDDPAIEMKGLYFNKQEFAQIPPLHDNCKCDIIDGEWILDPSACQYCIDAKDSYEFNLSKHKFAAVKDKQIIVGPAILANKLIYKKDDNGKEYYVRFTPENIKKIVSKFFSNGSNRRINVDHSNKIVDGYIQENWIIEDMTYDKSRYYGFEITKENLGSWFVEVKIMDEEFWNTEVKELGKYGFSIEGILGMKPMEFKKEITSLEQYIDEMSNDLIDKLLKEIKIS